MPNGNSDWPLTDTSLWLKEQTEWHNEALT